MAAPPGDWLRVMPPIEMAPAVPYITTDGVARGVVLHVTPTQLRIVGTAAGEPCWVADTRFARTRRCDLGDSQGFAHALRQLERTAHRVQDANNNASAGWLASYPAGDRISDCIIRHVSGDELTADKLARFWRFGLVNDEHRLMLARAHRLIVSRDGGPWEVTRD